MRNVIFLAVTLILFGFAISPLGTSFNGFNRDNYIISHLSIELLSIFVFASCVVIVLQPLHKAQSYYTNTIIIGFTAVALLDFIHAISYAGMPNFLSASSTPKSIFFWLAARYIELMTFILIAVKVRLWGTKLLWALMGLLLSLVVIYVGSYYLPFFPTTFEPGVGVTLFKKNCEYLLFLGNALLVGWFFVQYYRTKLSQHLLFAASAYSMALCSLSLTGYVAASDMSLLVGHILKLASALLIYKSIFWTELEKPYNQLHVAEMRSVRNERELDTILSNLPIGVIRFDSTFNYRYINRFMADFSDAMQGHQPETHIPNNLLAGFCDNCRQNLELAFSGQAVEFEHSVIKPDGTTAYCMVKAVPERQVDGSIDSVLCLVSDITTKVVAENEKRLAMKEMEELKTALDEHAIVAFTDARGVITSVNEKFCQISGYSRQELIGKTHKIINSGYHAPAFFKEMWQTISRGQFWHGEVCNRAKEGSLYWVSTTIVPFVSEQGRVLQYIAIRADITEQKLAEQEAKRLALFDDLTGLPNRRFLQEKIGELCTTKNTVSFHALMLLDLDNFKDINDSFGHSIGDDLLKQVAHRIQQLTNSAVNCARLGGDEFVLLLTELGDSQAQTLGYLLQMAQNICTFIAEPYQLSGKLVRTSASIGVSIFSSDVEDASEILKQADIALYQSKANGRNCVTFFDPVLQRAMDRRNETLRELKTAIERNELSLHYQPVVNADNRIKGVEALVRWHSPSLGPISPEVFIPLAEESTLILEIGQWVLRTACKQIHDWCSHPVRKHWVVAVNVSAKQLQRDNFVVSVIDTVNQYGISPASLQLEITESMLQEDVKNTTQAMGELKALGIRFSLDDFGTGYSSLNYLTKLPINTLKIDRSFVDRMLKSPEDASVVKTILSLARSLALDVVAEGVETEAQFMFLKQQRCPHFQGYLFSKPVNPENLPEETEMLV